MKTMRTRPRCRFSTVQCSSQMSLSLLLGFPTVSRFLPVLCCYRRWIWKTKTNDEWSRLLPRALWLIFSRWKSNDCMLLTYLDLARFAKWSKSSTTTGQRSTSSTTPKLVHTKDVVSTSTGSNSKRLGLNSTEATGRETLQWPGVEETRRNLSKLSFACFEYKCSIRLPFANLKKSFFKPW